MPRPEWRLVVSCEHGGAGVPRAWAHHFAGKAALLRSHRGWDPGALPAARSLARAFGAPLLAATTTRLLVDPNRSPHNPAVFAGLGARLAPAERAALLARFHRPHWERVRAAVRGGRVPVLHVAVHSFTPSHRGRRRAFDIGILYDPKRVRERALARDWQRRLREAGLRVRRNAPYRGDSDGLTTALRRELAAARYLGIELELSQRIAADPQRRRALVRTLAATLAAAADAALAAR